MTRKQLADKAGISIATLRYYEERGLLSPKRNIQNGYREYTQTHEIQLNLIIRFKNFGLTLKEIKTFFDLLDESRDNSMNFRAFLQKKQKDIDRQIQGLQQTKKSLQLFQNREDVETCRIYSKLLNKA